MTWAAATNVCGPITTTGMPRTALATRTTLSTPSWPAISPSGVSFSSPDVFSSSPARSSLSVARSRSPLDHAAPAWNAANVDCRNPTTDVVPVMPGTFDAAAVPRPGRRTDLGFASVAGYPRLATAQSRAAGSKGGRS